MSRLDNVSPFIVMDLVKESQKYNDTIHFEIGQPDLLPSKKVIEALDKAVREHHFSYTESLGLKSLREKISNYYKKTYQVDIPVERILLTPGTSGAFLIAYSLTMNTNDKIVLSDPSYPCYKNFAHLLDIEPIYISIGKEDEYELRVHHLEKCSQIKFAKAIHISSPSNPVGNVYHEDTLIELINFADKNNIAFISDELYHGLEYDERCMSALEVSQKVYVINGFSKYYCMPGFRLGWIIVPEDKVREAEILAQNLFISAPTLSQYAALEAFDDEYLAFVREEYRKRRDFLYEGLSEIFTVENKAQGAFYLWVDVSKFTDDSYDFAKKMIKEIHVAASPGIDFGKNKTNHYLRFSYTRKIEHMQEGLDRIRKWLKVR